MNTKVSQLTTFFGPIKLHIVSTFTHKLSDVFKKISKPLCE